MLRCDVDDDGVIFLWKILRREMTSIRFDVTSKPQAAVEIDLTDEVGSHATLVGWNPAKRVGKVSQLGVHRSTAAS